MSKLVNTQKLADSLFRDMVQYARRKRLYMHDVSFDALPMVEQHDVAMAIEFALDDPEASHPEWHLYDSAYDLYRPWTEYSVPNAEASRLARQVTKVVNQRITARNQATLDAARRQAGQSWSVVVWPEPQGQGKFALV